VETADAGYGSVVCNFDAAREQSLPQFVEVGGSEGGMGFFGGTKIAFDADVELLVAACEPAAATSTQQLRLFNFAQAEQRAVEIAGSGLAAFGGRNLEVVKMRDSNAHFLKRITIHNYICTGRLGVWGAAVLRPYKGKCAQREGIERTEPVKR
jgi:hypothetical protein